MIPSPTKIFRCQFCGHLAGQETQRSGNTIGAVYWTDGRVQAPMMPDTPVITRCFRCANYFWVDQAEEVGGLTILENQNKIHYLKNGMMRL